MGLNATKLITKVSPSHTIIIDKNKHHWLIRYNGSKKELCRHKIKLEICNNTILASVQITISLYINDKWYYCISNEWKGFDCIYKFNNVYFRIPKSCATIYKIDRNSNIQYHLTLVPVAIQEQELDDTFSSLKNSIYTAIFDGEIVNFQLCPQIL
jgi:hypothetical protein